MSRKLFLFCLLLSVSAQLALAQIVRTDAKNEELKKEAAAFLKETADDVDNLRTLENRVSFSSEIAALMWFEDEREAQLMFQKVIVDFRQLMMQIDAQYAALDTKTREELDAEPAEASKSQLFKKLRKVVSVRQQITLSIAEHDPQMAYDFFESTAQSVTNAALRAQIIENDQYFESKLISVIARTNPDKALEGGRKRLAKGVNFELIELLKKIYDKDADKGITFGEEMVAKIKTESSKAISLYILSGMLRAGEENLSNIKNKPGKKPLLNDQSMREMAELLAQELLKRENDEMEVILSDLSSYLRLIEKYSPARAALLRQKFKLAKPKSTDAQDSTEIVESTVSETSAANSKNAQNPMDFYTGAQNIGKQLSKEERDKLVGESRAALAGIKDREQKMLALSYLSGQLALAGDKEAAAGIMNEAREMVNLQPKNYKDYFGVWVLASGYALSDPDKAFPLLEDAISRLNETIAGFVKVAEFIDVEGEIIDGDELQVGVFGGMARDMLGALGGNTLPMLRNLASSDFARTRAMTNKFDRPELRILSKMLVLRAVLGEQKAVE